MSIAVTETAREEKARLGSLRVPPTTTTEVPERKEFTCVCNTCQEEDTCVTDYMVRPLIRAVLLLFQASLRIYASLQVYMHRVMVHFGGRCTCPVCLCRSMFFAMVNRHLCVDGPKLITECNSKNSDLKSFQRLIDLICNSVVIALFMSSESL